jgi:hypothetical protein
MKVQVLSKKTKGGLFIQFDISSPGEEEVDKLAIEPPGAMYELLLEMETELRESGEICDSPDTGMQERIEPISDSSYVIGGYYEVRDEPASEAFIERLRSIFPNADIDVEYV